MADRRSTPSFAEAATLTPDREDDWGDGKTQPLAVIAGGTVIDHFKVVRLVGEGGMGMVYLAQDQKLGRNVALKVVRRGYLGERGMATFLREARATATFNHPHIVTIYAAGEWNDNPYVALEYLEGQDLRGRLRDGPLGVTEAMRIGLAVAEALAEAHRHGILHRDLKPENIFIPRDGRVRVVDFGLARSTTATLSELDASARGSSLPKGTSQATGWAGTPEYMSPEQWLLLDLTPALDVWALGVVLYELVEGCVPYPLTPGLSLRGLAGLVSDLEPCPAVEAEEVPAALRDLIASCLEKDPEMRPSAEELASSLQELLHQPKLVIDERIGPFRGLLPYGEEEAERYFGRESELDGFLERVRDRAVLPVVGPSGAGKSSFVMAGVVPRLRERGFEHVVTCRPARDPFRQLAHRILTPGGKSSLSSEARRAIEKLAADLREEPENLHRQLVMLAQRRRTRVVLVIDPLEELFTLHDDPGLHRAFMDAICLAADDMDDDVRVVFAVRDDYLGRIAVSPTVQRALSSVTVLRAPDANTMLDILQRTAALGGCRFEDDELPREMVASVDGEPTALPLVQFAAQLLWDQRDRKRGLLLRSAYEAMGGVAGALASHAESTLAGMSVEQVELARGLFLRLVTSERTRRLTTREEVLRGQPDGAAEVLDRFVASRLVVAKKHRGENSLELAHESLVRNWQTLGRWIEGSREELIIRQEVITAAELWDRRGRHDAELWQGEALRDALRRLSRLDAPALGGVGEAFLETARGRDQRRRRQRVAGLALGGLLVLAGLVFLLVQKQRADHQRDVAQAEAARAEEREAGALLEAARAAYLNGGMLEARAKLRAALEKKDDPLARALWWQLLREPKQWLLPLNAIIYDLAVSPDDRWAIVAAQNHVAYVVDTTTRETFALRGHRDQVTSVAVSPDGKWVVTADWSGRVIRWRTSDWQLDQEVQGHDGYAWQISFTDDGSVVTGGADGTVVLYPGAELEGEPRRIVAGNRIRGLATIPGTSHAIVGAMDGEISRWDLNSGKKLESWPTAWPEPLQIAANPDGKRVCITSRRSGAGLFSVETGKLISGLGTYGGQPAFSADGKRLAITSRDGVLRIFDGVDGRLLSQTKLPSQGRALGFLSRGRRMVLATADGVEMRYLDEHRAGRGGAIAHEQGVVGAAVSPVGSLLASADYDGRIVLWDAPSGREVAQLDGHTDSVHSLAFASDGTQLFSAGTDRQLRIWDVATGRTVKSLNDADGPLYSLAVNEELIAAGTLAGQLYVWARGSGRLEYDVHLDDIRGLWGLRILRDGSVIASGRHGGMARVAGGRVVAKNPDMPHVAETDMLDGKLLAIGDGVFLGAEGDLAPRKLEIAGLERRLYTGAWLADGRRVLVGGKSGKLVTIDTTTSTVVRERRAHDGELNRIAATPDRSRAMTAGDDGVVRYWNAESLEPVWQGRALLAQPARFYSHEGWRNLAAPDAEVKETALERAAAARAVRTEVEPNGHHVCMLVEDGGPHVELWVRGEDAPVARAPSDSGFRVLPHGCVVAHGDGLSILGREGAGPAMETGRVTGLGVIRRGEAFELLVATPGVIRRLDESGRELSRREVHGDVVALTEEGGTLVVGFGDGTLQALPKVPEGRPRLLAVAGGRMTNLVPGPPGFVLGGSVDGRLGMWHVASGSLIASDRLHGPIAFMHREGDALYAATTLGRTIRWDLSAFSLDYCELLAQVQREVPVRWEGGAVAAPPTPCTGR